MGYSVRFPGGSSDSHSAEPETKSRESLIHIKDAEVVRSVTERTVIIDRRLLRGVPLHAIVANMGDLLMPSGGIGGGATAETFAFSAEVDSLDFFLSHSWRDSGKLKWILMLWEMNFTSALLLSNLGGVVVLAVICSLPSLPGKISTATMSYLLRVFVEILFLLHLLFAHRISGTNPMFFLDKACINQTDPVLKELGIKNIGGFLRRSSSMLVICGRDYCSRLWCCYELSLYILLRGTENVRFVPLFQSGFFTMFILTPS